MLSSSLWEQAFTRYSKHFVCSFTFVCFDILIIKLWIDFRLGRCNRSVGQSCCEGDALFGLVAGLVGD